jgi:hypothetical protein
MAWTRDQVIALVPGLIAAIPTFLQLAKPL